MLEYELFIYPKWNQIKGDQSKNVVSSYRCRLRYNTFAINPIMISPVAGL